MNHTVTIFLLLFSAACGSRIVAAEVEKGIYYADKAPAVAESEKHPLVHWTESREGPQVIHYLRIDLESDLYELTTMISPDNDGDGPGEAMLAIPETYMASNATVLVAINANAFRSPEEVTDTDWFLGKSVDIDGFAFNRERKASLPNGAPAFWLDKAGKAHIGIPTNLDDILLSVGAHKGGPPRTGELLRNGKKVFVNVVERHPRTALGVDQSGRWVTFVVVDGRREGYSHGATLAELAEILQQCGCFDAITLDGGGSSIMISSDGPSLKTINRPSGNKSRPIPVMLGVRKK